MTSLHRPNPATRSRSAKEVVVVEEAVAAALQVRPLVVAAQVPAAQVLHQAAPAHQALPARQVPRAVEALEVRQAAQA